MLHRPRATTPGLEPRRPAALRRQGPSHLRLRVAVPHPGPLPGAPRPVRPRHRRRLHRHHGRGRPLHGPRRLPRATGGAAEDLLGSASSSRRRAALVVSEDPVVILWRRCWARSAPTARTPAPSRRWSRRCARRGARSRAHPRLRLVQHLRLPARRPRCPRRRRLAARRARRRPRRPRRLPVDARDLCAPGRRPGRGRTPAAAQPRRAAAGRPPSAGVAHGLTGRAASSCRWPACRPSTRWPEASWSRRLLVYWFHVRFGAGPEVLGPLFFGTSLLSRLPSWRRCRSRSASACSTRWCSRTCPRTCC